MSRYEISAERDGYRRAGREWFRRPTPVAPDEFDEAQWEQLVADPRITIAEAEDPPERDRGRDALHKTVVDALLAPHFVHDVIDTYDVTEMLNPRWGDGDLCELLEWLAARVADSGAPAPPAPAAADSGGGGPTGPLPDGAPQGRAQRIQAAAASLDRGNADLWMKDGRPTVWALRTASGLADVTAAERDAAWVWFEGRDLTGG